MENVLRHNRKQILLFTNPRAGRGRTKATLDEFIAELQSRGYHIETVADPESLSTSASRLGEREGLHMVIAAGGDGTARLVFNRLAERPPVLVLPMGTENLLAKYLGIDFAPKQWCDLVEHGKTVTWDAGRVIDGDQRSLFMLMVGCGFDAEVVRRLDATRSGNIHHLSYVKPILDSIRRYEYPELRIEASNADGEWTERVAHWAFVFNIPAYGGGLRIAPVADPADGMLDLCTFWGGSFARGLFHLATVLLRQQGSWSGFSQTRARRFRISSTNEVPYQVDGDSGGFLPIEVETAAEKIELVVPADWVAPSPMR